jgi:hypothetical protein
MSRRELLGLLKDRTKMMDGARVLHVPPDLAPAYFESSLQPLEVQLGHAGPYLCGPAPSIADFAAYHSLWFLLQNGDAGQVLANYPRVQEWSRRVDGFRTAPVDELSGAAAIEIARATPPPPPEQARVEHSALQAGDMVDIVPTDYGFDPVRGELIKLVGNEIAIRRQDERAGELIVHFPVVGYEIRPAG